MMSQTLLRAMAHGAIKRILHIEEHEPINDVLLLGDVVVTPSGIVSSIITVDTLYKDNMDKT